jgi:hypothetical protein
MRLGRRHWDLKLEKNLQKEQSICDAVVEVFL